MLRVPLVQLEKPYARTAKSQRTIVIPCTANHNLARPGGNSAQHFPVEESGPAGDVLDEPGRMYRPDSGAEFALRIRVAVRSDRPIQAGPNYRNRLAGP